MASDDQMSRDIQVINTLVQVGMIDRERKGTQEESEGVRER